MRTHRILILLAAGSALFAAWASGAPTVERPTWISGPRRAAFEPAACVDDAGRLWVAWVSSNRAANTSARLDGACLVEGEVVASFQLEDAGLLPAVPTLAAFGDGAYLAWESGGDGERALFGRTLELADGDVRLGARESVPSPAATPLAPRLARSPAGLVLVHQGLAQLDYDLFVSTRGENGWSEATALTDTATDEWNPALAAGPDGTIHLAWDAWSGTSYDVHYARIEERALHDERVLASGPDYQGFPALAVSPEGEAWIAWEVAAQFGEYGGLRAERSLELARVGTTEEGAIEVRWAASAELEVGARAELPALAAGPDGLRLVSSTPIRGDRKRDHLYTAWTSTVLEFPRGTTRVRELDKTDGNGDGDSVLVADPAGGAWLVVSADLRSEGFEDIEAWSDAIERRPRVGVVRLRGASGVPTTRATPPEPRRNAPAPPLQRPRGAGRGERILWGDLHRHTHLSRCSGAKDGTILDAYRYARGPGDLDFLAVTDHFQHMKPWSWLRSKRDVVRYHAPGSLVVFAGVERVRAKRGHYNDVYLDPLEAPFDPDTWMRPPARFAPVAPERVLSIPHMMSVDDGTAFDWDEFDEDRLRLFEVFQGKRGSYEGAGLPFEAEDRVEDERAIARGFERGAHFGLIAASDHVSSSTAFAGLYAEELTRAAIFQALRDRRAFAATARRQVDLAWGSLVMGEAGDPGRAGEVVVRVPYSDAPLAYVELVANGVVHDTRRGRRPVESWVLTLRKAPLTSHGVLEVEAVGGALSGVAARRPGSPGLAIESVDEERLRVRRTDFVQVDVRFDVEWGAADADAMLVLSAGDTRVEVRRDEVGLGASHTVDEGGLHAQLWRQGRPLGADGGELSFPLRPREGTSVYARIAWTDGNLAWTSPITVRKERGE